MHAKPNAVCYRTAYLRFCPKRLYGWYGNCEIEDSWWHIATIWPSLRWPWEVLRVFKWCKKYFILYDLRTIYVIYIRPKMECNSHLWAGASKNAIDFVDRIQNRASNLIGDYKVASSIIFLGHRRNVSCIVLFGKMLVRTLWIYTAAKGIHEEYQAIRTKQCFHCCDYVPPHKTL